MKKSKIKTLDVNCLEWFDKINGNSYFAATIIINYQMKTEKRFILPFQYGYGDQYRFKAFEKLQKEGYIPKEEKSFWMYCDKNKIITRFTKHENCKKRELKNIY